MVTHRQRALGYLSNRCVEINRKANECNFHGFSACIATLFIFGCITGVISGLRIILPSP